jgi:hypothetical protein
VQRSTVGVAINDYRAHTHFPAGAHDAHGDFTAICNEDFAKHFGVSAQT